MASATRGGAAERVVRYEELRPCLNAFIDTRSPGSEAKENFTIIGPGVSENPDQHVHFAEPHGFNIGGARQPPGCVNSQHSHETAEVFVAHTGRWRFDLGVDGQDAQVELGPGDVISLPTHAFRGFTNVGDDTGFLWAVLGGDDPGRVMWAPQVFDMAADYGLVLLDSGALVDTTAGQTVPPDAKPMARTTQAQVDSLRRYTPAEAEALVVRAGEAAAAERPVIGPGAPLDWPHGFSLTRLQLEPGQSQARDAADASEVIFVHAGDAAVAWDGSSFGLGAGDTASVPAGSARTLSSKAGATVFVVRGEAGAT